MGGPASTFITASLFTAGSISAGTLIVIEKANRILPAILLLVLLLLALPALLG